MLQHFQGIAFRAHDSKWSFEPTSGEGAAKHGGRFNPKGMPALYLSLSQMGALLEAQQGFSRKAQPKLICAYDINVNAIADLTRAEVRAHFDISLDKLDCAWLVDDNPYTHQVTRKLIKEDVAGIIVPSYASGAQDCLNLVLWKWSNKLPYQVNVIDDYQALPKSQDSWR